MKRLSRYLFFTSLLVASLVPAFAVETVERWVGDSAWSYEISPKNPNDPNSESDAYYATVLRMRCDGFNQSGVRYIMGFGVTSPKLNFEPDVGMPIVITVDGRPYAFSAVRDSWAREGYVPAIMVWSDHPLLEALQAGQRASIYFGSVKIKDIHLRGSRKTFRRATLDC